MRKLCWLILISVLAVACQRAEERASQHNQTLLEEADLQLDARNFVRAHEHAAEALSSLVDLSKKDPGHTDIQLLKIRAYLTVFFADNALLIESADPLPRSLVTLPRHSAYIGYEEHIEPAQKELIQLANASESLDHEQRAYVYGSLAAIYRLDQQTAATSAREYAKAIHVYEEWLASLKTEKKAIGSNTFAIEKINAQIRAMRTAQAEAWILAEKWEEAQKSLEAAVAGDDLKYFTLHFGRLEKRRVILEAKVREEAIQGKGSKQDRLLQMVKDRVAKRQFRRNEFAGLSPYAAELILTESELYDLKTNLSYRVLCAHRLGQKKEVATLRRTLREFYPDADAELAQALGI